MSRITIEQYAEHGMRFGAHAFDGQVGREVPLTIAGQSVPAVLRSADVSHDGRSASLTFDTPLSAAVLEIVDVLGGASSYSVGTTLRSDRWP